MSFTPFNNHVQFKGKVGGTRVVFEDQVYRLTGGFLFMTSQLPNQNVGCLPAGTPVHADENLRILDIHYAFAVAENAAADATEIKLVKGFEGSRVQEGMLLMVAQKSVDTKAAKAVEVKGVDRSNPEYDVVTVTEALGSALKGGDVMWEAKADGEKFVIKVVPNALNQYDCWKDPNTTCVDGSAVFGSNGCVLENRIPPISPAVRAALKDADCFFRFSTHQ